MRQRSARTVVSGLAALIGALALSGAASGTGKPPEPPQPSQGTETFLIRQDFSDCQNSNVNAGNPSLIGGTVFVQRQSNGTTVAKVAITGTANTTYTIFHKCVGTLGTIVTQDEDEGSGTFQFQTNPGILTFDMYPNGAPSGNKFQSVPITLH
ncbi:MAG TPA: hypothetical protein VMF32_01835 [Xanthobacteraceae bacterium]|nr:hypothetical protein [Xanthobacteraceae bacterium]